MTSQSLITRRINLALQTEIPDMLAYAEEWNKLGADFQAEGAIANANICFSNWRRYGGQAGAYRREMIGKSFAELQPMDGSVTVQIDGDTKIKFPDYDKLASWLVDVMD